MTGQFLECNIPNCPSSNSTYIAEAETELPFIGFNTSVDATMRSPDARSGGDDVALTEKAVSNSVDDGMENNFIHVISAGAMDRSHSWRPFLLSVVVVLAFVQLPAV
jgi:hypothetical protein